MNLRVPRVLVNSKRQRKPKVGKSKDKPAQRKLKRALRKPKSQQKGETDGQRHQEYTKIENNKSWSIVEKAGGNKGNCRVRLNRKGLKDQQDRRHSKGKLLC